jgi:hypothetical protein
MTIGSCGIGERMTTAASLAQAYFVFALLSPLARFLIVPAALLSLCSRFLCSPAVWPGRSPVSLLANRSGPVLDVDLGNLGGTFLVAFFIRRVHHSVVLCVASRRAGNAAFM